MVGQKGDEGNDVGAGDTVNVELRGKGCVNYRSLLNRRERGEKKGDKRRRDKRKKTEKNLQAKGNFGFKTFSFSLVVGSGD